MSAADLVATTIATTLPAPLTGPATALLVALLWPAVYLYVFWLLYVLVMGFYRAWLAKRLTRTALVLAGPVIALGWVVDWFANWTLATLIFLEPPRRALELVTDRLTRYITTPSGWRAAPARWVCATLLDYFDPHDRHCV